VQTRKKTTLRSVPNLTQGPDPHAPATVGEGDGPGASSDTPALPASRESRSDTGTACASMSSGSTRKSRFLLTVPKTRKGPEMPPTTSSLSSSQHAYSSTLPFFSSLVSLSPSRSPSGAPLAPRRAKTAEILDRRSSSASAVALKAPSRTSSDSGTPLDHDSTSDVDNTQPACEGRYALYCTVPNCAALRRHFTVPLFSSNSYPFFFLLSLIPAESRLGKVASLLAVVSRERSKTTVTGSSDWTGRGTGRGSIVGTSPSMKVITSRGYDKKSWAVGSSSSCSSSSRPGHGPYPVADAITRDGQLPTTRLATGDAEAEVSAVGNSPATNGDAPSGAASSSTRREQRGRPTTDPGRPPSSSLRPPFSTLSNNREKEADVPSAPRIVRMKATAPPSVGPSIDCAPIRDKATDRSQNPFVKKSKKKRVSSKVELVEDGGAAHSSRGSGSGDPTPSVASKPTNKPSDTTPVSRSGSEDSLRGWGGAPMAEIEGEDQNEEENEQENQNEIVDGEGDRMDVSEERAVEEEYRILRARMEENACSEINSRMVMMQEDAETKGYPGSGALTALHRELRIATASATASIGARAGANRGSGNSTKTGHGVKTGIGLDVSAAEVNVKTKVIEPLAEVIATMSPMAILSLFQELEELEDEDEEEEYDEDDDEGEEEEEYDEEEEEYDEEEETGEIFRSGTRLSNIVEWADQEYIGVDLDGSVKAEAVAV
jgi:hypothetical protein